MYIVAVKKINEFISITNWLNKSIKGKEMGAGTATAAAAAAVRLKAVKLVSLRGL